MAITFNKIVLSVALIEYSIELMLLNLVLLLRSFAFRTGKLKLNYSRYLECSLKNESQFKYKLTLGRKTFLTTSYTAIS